MYAIIKAGGKEFKVTAGDVISVDRLSKEVGERVEFPVVLTVDGENISTETKNVLAKATVVEHFKDKKIVVFKYKAKKNERCKQGHRQSYTKVKIDSIG